jgi:hypothetical protein
MVNSMTTQQNKYFQQVKASSRAFGFLGLLLGVTAGGLTGVAVKGLIGDPVVSGGGAIAFYAAFGASSLVTLYVMFNYLSMTLLVSEDSLDIRMGMKASTVSTESISAVRVAPTQSRMARAATQARAGGRGISKMWSVFGVKSGIEIDIRSGDASTETWFIASLDSETLSERLGAVVSSNASGDTATES